jgi:hypothetical protein
MNDIHSVDYIPTLSYQNANPSRVARLPSMGSSDGGTLVVFEEGNRVWHPAPVPATHRALDGGALCNAVLRFRTVATDV